MTNFTAIVLCDGFNEKIFPMERESYLQIFEENNIIKNSLFNAGLLNLMNSALCVKIIIVARETDRFAINNAIKNINQPNYENKINYIYYKNTQNITPEMFLYACNLCDENIGIFFANKLIQNYDKVEKILLQTPNLSKPICIESSQSFLDFVFNKPTIKAAVFCHKVFLQKLFNQKYNTNLINVVNCKDFVVIEQSNCKDINTKLLYNIIDVIQGRFENCNVFNASCSNSFFKSVIKNINGLCKNVFYSKNNQCNFVKSSKTWVYSNTIQKKDIFCIGLKNIVISDCDDILVVSNKKFDNSHVVKQLKQIKSEKLQLGSKVYRPWGFYEVLRDEPNYKTKTITVYPLGILSLQSHKKRAEHWVVTKGIATVVLNENTYTLQTGESIYIPLLAKHSLQNRTNEFLQVVETQVGEYFGEDDITRYEDVYGRG